MITAPAIKFKGSGWYVTDYAGKSPDGGSKEKTTSEGKIAGEKMPAAKTVEARTAARKTPKMGAPKKLPAKIL